MKSLKSCHKPYQVIEGRTQSKTGRIRENFLLEEGGIGSYWLRYDSHKRKKFKYRIEYVSYDYCTKCENGWNYADTTFADKKVVLNKTTGYLLHQRELKKKLQTNLHANFYWLLRKRIKAHLEDWDGECNVRGAWKKEKGGYPRTHSVNFYLRNKDFKYKILLPNESGSWWNGASVRSFNNRALLWFFDNHGTNFSTFKLKDEEVWLKTDKDLLYFREHFKPDRNFMLQGIRIFKAVNWTNVKNLI